MNIWLALAPRVSWGGDGRVGAGGLAVAGNGATQGGARSGVACFGVANSGVGGAFGAVGPSSSISRGIMGKVVISRAVERVVVHGLEGRRTGVDDSEGNVQSDMEKGRVGESLKANGAELVNSVGRAKGTRPGAAQKRARQSAVCPRGSNPHGYLPGSCPFAHPLIHSCL